MTPDRHFEILGGADEVYQDFEADCALKLWDYQRLYVRDAGQPWRSDWARLYWETLERAQRRTEPAPHMPARTPDAGPSGGPCPPGHDTGLWATLQGLQRATIEAEAAYLEQMAATFPADARRLDTVRAFLAAI